jgi:hypothetical protein
MRLLLLIVITFSTIAKENRIYFSGDNKSYSCKSYLLKLKDTLVKNKNKPLVFYIHGRGKHPQKGISYLPLFENRYNINVMMFHWDSWINQITRPESNAVSAADDLQTCLKNFNEFKSNNTSLFKYRKVFLMAHSMGNIVLKSYLEKYQQGHLSKGLFDKSILNAPDVPASNHYIWLENIFDFSNQAYVTYNNDDIVLLGSRLVDLKDRRLFRGNRLGASRFNFLLFGSDISDRVTYMDFTMISFGGHRYFLPGDNEDKDLITKVYDSLFHSKPYPHHIKRLRSHPNIIIFRK